MCCLWQIVLCYLAKPSIYARWNYFTKFGDSSAKLHECVAFGKWFYAIWQHTNKY